MKVLLNQCKKEGYEKYLDVTLTWKDKNNVVKKVRVMPVFKHDWNALHAYFKGLEDN